jgi:hypothetical protein
MTRQDVKILCFCLFLVFLCIGIWLIGDTDHAHELGAAVSLFAAVVFGLTGLVIALLQRLYPPRSYKKPPAQVMTHTGISIPRR